MRPTKKNLDNEVLDASALNWVLVFFFQMWYVWLLLVESRRRIICCFRWIIDSQKSFFQPQQTGSFRAQVSKPQKNDF